MVQRKKTKEALQYSERRYRDLAESISDIFFAFDDELRYTYWNRASEELTGISTGDALGKHIYDLFPGTEMTRRVEKEYLKALKTKKPRHFTNKYQFGGKDFIFQISVYPSKGGLSVLARDLTERKELEESLRESEKNYRSLFDNMLDGFAYCKILVNEDNQPIDFVHLEVNNSWEKIIGLRREDVIGKKVTEAIPSIKESKTDLISIYGKVALTGEATKFDLYFDPLQKWFTIAVYSPKKSYFVVTFDDITDHKRLRENMQFYISEITMAQEEERRRIARELHDETIQLLASLSHDIEAIDNRRNHLSQDTMQRLEQLRNKIRSIMHGVRRFSHELRPDVLDRLGMIPALESLVDELKRETKINAHVEVIGFERRLPLETELLLFRITQEAMHNIHKHSQAKDAAIRIEFNTEGVELVVTDNGRGFLLPDTLGDLASQSKLGLLGMQERARLLNGSFSVSSEVDKGTKVAVVIELKN